MKVFHVISGFCHWDATAQFPCLDATIGCFPPSDLFVEAPDYVFEGWGYDPSKKGDERFIQPEPPEGWLYDKGTGTFYPEGETAPSEQPTPEDRIATLESENKLLKEQVKMQSQQQTFLEDCLLEIGDVVYA